MTIDPGTVSQFAYHPDASQPTGPYSASVIDCLEADCRRSPESGGTGKEAPIEQGHRRAIYRLISLAVLVSLLVGILCLMASVTPRTDGNGQLDPAAEGAPSQVEVTIGEAIQALGVRH